MLEINDTTLLPTKNKPKYYFIVTSKRYNIYGKHFCTHKDARRILRNGGGDVVTVYLNDGTDTPVSKATRGMNGRIYPAVPC